MRLIDADALSSKGWMLARFYDGNKLVKTMPLSEVPTIDTRPGVHWRWIWHETGDLDWEQFYSCPNCGERQYWESHFCPNCGCIMDGGDEDGTD